tara:strand:+ start:371 stop:556 length:186 start_codon:yes stop_codon:yes gene_type:complete
MIKKNSFFLSILTKKNKIDKIVKIYAKIKTLNVKKEIRVINIFEKIIKDVKMIICPFEKFK